MIPRERIPRETCAKAPDSNLTVYRGGNEFSSRLMDVRFLDSRDVARIPKTSFYRVKLDEVQGQQHSQNYQIKGGAQGRGISVNSNYHLVKDPHVFVLPDRLDIVKTGSSPTHYEIAPQSDMTFGEYQTILNGIRREPL
jgi:hypothetical protein